MAVNTFIHSFTSEFMSANGVRHIQSCMAPCHAPVMHDFLFC